MPAELMNCVSSVKKSGKDESSAYGICSSKTGWKRKKKGWKNTKTGKTFKESTNEFDSLLEECIKDLKFLEKLLVNNFR